jgi:hypothetical protein
MFESLSPVAGLSMAVCHGYYLNGSLLLAIDYGERESSQHMATCSGKI